ncbi:MAG TPA: T9SS type A sorting domain-containing protein, partial [Flavobacteriales bacterium]|nr:T9SS type A sorting domain-containing protein [Flavobacteriales bacterium]
PEDSPFAAAYPATTLCAERFQNGNTEWRHYLVDATHAEMIGISAEDFSGGRTYCNFPFTIGSTFTDDWYLNGNTYSDTYTYVASGEVLAPWGTIPDVVMFETSGGFSYYLYLANNLLDPIGGYTPGFGIDLWKVDIANGISETPAPTINLWPNPTADQLVIDLAPQPGFTYRLADMHGQLMHSGYTTSERMVLDLRSCAAGVYTVQVTDARGRLAVEKVMVE